MTLIIADTYAEAERMAEGTTTDWLWFSDAAIAGTWIRRCRERGVVIYPAIRQGIYRRTA